jgi:sortase (surface protein transpeptidase)
MSDRGRHTGTGARPPRGRSAVAAAVALACAAIGIGSLAYATTNGGGGPPAPAAAGSIERHVVSEHQQGKETAEPRGPLMGRSRPVRLHIPSVKIDTDLLRLGLNTDGSLQVPWKPLLAGWYEGSPTPGQLGPSIIAGHVDSWATGPAVFYRLGRVEVDARVRVTRADSSVAAFKVTAVRSYPKKSFPTSLVYGDVNRAELRLITCGNWNSTKQEYDNNVVVFAHLTRTSA